MELKIAGLVLGCMALFAVFCFYSNRKNRMERMARIRRSWGERPVREYTAAEFEAIGSYFKRTGKERYSIDDITWNDLDMDTIFMLLNHTWSLVSERAICMPCCERLFFQRKSWRKGSG